MKKNLPEVKDKRIYALHLLVNEKKTPEEISKILDVAPITIISWLQKNDSANVITKLKNKIISLEQTIYKLRGNIYY